MNQNRKLFFRTALVLVLVVMVAFAAVPYSASAMLALQTYDFNTCSLPGGWTFENPKPSTVASAATVGAFSGDSYLKLSLGAGTYASMTSGNVLAPRLMTPITDTSFEVEARFLAPQISTSAGYKIEGLLFRDASDAANVKWLRIDFNSTNNVINSYITILRTNAAGFIDNSKVDIDPVTALKGGPTTTNAILLRVKYVKETGAWTVTYNMNGQDTVIPFNESEFGAGIPTFAPDSMGLFIANSSTGMLAHESRVDYVHVIGSTLSDDVVKLTVNTTGTGTVSQTACTGNVVTLTAVPTSGAAFTGWQGADNNAANPTTVTMTASKTVTAMFSGSLVLDQKFFMPMVSK